MVLTAIRAHIVEQRKRQLAAGPAWRASGLLFTSPIGTPLDPRNASRMFYDMLAEAGDPRVRFHDLRHTAATLLLVFGVHPRVVMETLGHSSIKLTLDTYSHVIPPCSRTPPRKLTRCSGPKAHPDPIGSTNGSTANPSPAEIVECVKEFGEPRRNRTLQAAFSKLLTARISRVDYMNRPESTSVLEKSCDFWC